MIITIASFKGGVGKTTTAIHLAAYFSQKGKTVLIDGDVNRSAIDWSQRGAGNLSFAVIDENEVQDLEAYRYIVIDTPARPSDVALRELAESSDLLIIPTATDAFSIAAMVKTVNVLVDLPGDCYRVLLTICPPPPSRDEMRAREVLTEVGLPLFKASIRRLAAFQKSALDGVPVYDVKDARAQQAWNDYVKVFKEIGK
jgi:chromosome partitioning protein